MMRSMRKMSSSGDTKVADYETGVTSPARLKEIETEFNRLVKEGYFAVDVTDQRDVKIDKFDPKADILMIPRVSGGR